jgi:hypothetical protein
VEDRDLFAQWAAEEFVAAGRVSAEEGRLGHRQRGELFADICHGLQQPFPPLNRLTGGRNRKISHIQALLSVAFGQPAHSRTRQPVVRAGRATPRTTETPRQVSSRGVRCDGEDAGRVVPAFST